MEKRKSTWMRAIAIAVTCLIIGGLFLVVMLSSSSNDSEEESIEIRAYVKDKEEYTLENDNIKFVMEADTTHFTVTQKNSGEVWYSNPVDADNDAAANTVEQKGNLQSTAIIEYSTENGVDTRFNNYNYSISRGIYEIEEGSDYIKVKYSLGNTSKVFYIPIEVPASRMDELLGQLSDSDVRQVKEYYRKYDIKKLRSTDNKDELLAKYPDLESQNVYVLRDGLADHIKEKLQTVFANIGYTSEDYEADLAIYGNSGDEQPAIFNYSVIYRIEDNELVVEVPMDEMEYPKKYPFTGINILPFFGAGTKEEEGFIFVPEGGGSIINFNNGKLTANGYYSDLYGWDYAITRESVIHETKIEFPVFGISKQNASFICILEDGASYANIEADISGKLNSYNSASANYTTLHSEAYDVSEKSNSAVYVYEKQIPEESLIQRYHFIDGNGYTGMANAYREYLLKEYPELVLNTDASTPVAIELVGAIDKVQQKLGMPLSLPVELTSYTAAQEIIDELRNVGFDNMYVKYVGWMNGGVNQKLLSDVDLISDLGSKKDFNNLVAYMNENQIPFYLDGVVQNAYDSDILDGFITFRDAAKFTSQEETELYHYDSVDFSQQDWKDTYYLLKPKKMLQMISNLKAAAKEYGVTGVSFRDLGDTLSADYNKRNWVTRETSKGMQIEAMKDIQASGLGIMINSGNAYAAPYADYITNMDIKGSPYAIIDEQVPFYQMVLHGYVNYSSEAINLSSDYMEAVLQSAEAGAGLSFVFMEEEATKLQSTYYTQYFGADYHAWKDMAIEIFTEYNEKLGHLFNQTIIDHYKINSLVSATVYEDGSIVYVNYGLKDYNENGIEIPAKSYIVERGE